MSWLLFLDDDRIPAESIDNDEYRHKRHLPPLDPALRLLPRQWTIARSVPEALELIEKHGMPSFIAFDHDLGDGTPTGYEFVQMLVDMDLDGRATFPVGFSYEVHSANVEGAKYIRSKMDRYLRFKREERHSLSP